MKVKAVERQVGPYAVVFEITRTGYSAYAHGTGGGHQAKPEITAY
jgi:hypothetical protein